ncbi:hypothetical protein [Chryseobacterium mulctrae]|uniref:hypothetical protein n=1 Tax=Chryseobacterium mulctrae TaxID=2576777 RepID=UPI001115D932|nr:hypothetical protein [Chryseobacterium mulctrae]
MNEFNFSEVFNKYEDKIGEITTNYINDLKSQNLSHFDMTSYMTHKIVELESDLTNELSQFATTYVNDTADLRAQQLITTDPTVLISFQIHINMPKIKLLIAMYNHEADIVMRRFIP